MGVWDRYDLTGVGDVESPFGNSASSGAYDPLSALQSMEAQQPQYAPERGFFMDAVSNLSRGVVSGVGLAGAALDQFGLENNWDQWAQTADQKYTFLQQDRSEALGQESWLKSSAMGALQSAPATLIPMAAGIGAGALVGGGVPGAVAGAGAGIATLVGLFGAGTYNQTYRQAVEDGLDPEAAKGLAFETAAWEVGTEGLSDAAAVVTGGLLGAPLKALGQGAKQTIKGMLELGPAGFAKAVGTTMSAEVGSEALNAYMQTSAQIKAGLDPGMSPTQASLAAIGPAMFLSGGIALGIQGLNQQRKAQIVTALQSEQAPTEVKLQAIDIIDKQLRKTSIEAADSWTTVANHILENNGKFNINTDFVAQANRIIEQQPATAAEEAQQLEENATAIRDTELNMPDEALAPEEAYQQYSPDLPPGINALPFEERMEQQWMKYDPALPSPFEQDISQILNVPLAPTLGPAPTSGAPVRPAAPTAQQRFTAEQQQAAPGRTPTAAERFAAEQGNVDPMAQQAADAEARLREAEARVFADQVATAELDVATRPDRTAEEHQEILGLEPETWEALNPELKDAILSVPLAQARRQGLAAYENVFTRFEAETGLDTDQEMEAAPADTAPRRALTEPEIAEVRQLTQDYAELSEDTAATADPAAQIEMRDIAEQIVSYAQTSEVPLNTLVPEVDRIDVGLEQQEIVNPVEIEATAETAADQAYEIAAEQAFSQKFDNFQEAMSAYRGRSTVDPAYIQELKALPPEQRQEKANELLTAALVKADTDGIKKVLQLYERNSQTPAVANAVFDVVDTIQSEEMVDLIAASQLTPEGAQAGTAEAIEAETQRKLAYVREAALDVLSETMHRTKGVQVGTLTPDGFMEWTRKGPNLYTATNPMDGETYFLFRSHNEGPWRIFTSQKETVKYGKGKKSVELTTLQEVPAYVDKQGKPVLSKAAKGQKLEAYLRQFYRNSGVTGMNLVPTAEVSDSADAYSGGGTTKNSFVTKDGRYVVVPTDKKGKWSILRKEDFDRYKSLSTGEKRAAKIPVGKSGVLADKEAALKKAYRLMQGDRTVEEAPKEQKLTAESEIVSQMRQDQTGETPAEETPEVKSVKLKKAEKEQLLYRVEQNRARVDAQMKQQVFRFMDYLGRAIRKGDTGQISVIFSNMQEAFSAKNVKGAKNKRSVRNDLESMAMVAFGSELSAIDKQKAEIDQQLQEVTDKATKKELAGQPYEGLKKDAAKLQLNRDALESRQETLVATARRYNTGLPKDTDAALKVLTSMTLNDIPMLKPTAQQMQKMPAKLRREMLAQSKELKAELSKALYLGETAAGSRVRKQAPSKFGEMYQQGLISREEALAGESAEKIANEQRLIKSIEDKKKQSKEQKAAQQEIIATRGPLKKTKASPHWRSDNGLELRKDGSKWVTYNSAGEATGLSYPSIAAAAKDQVFSMPQARTPEAIASEQEAAAWRAAQEAKAAEQRMPTEAEILATPGINGWATPVKQGETISMETSTGRLRAVYVTRKGAFKDYSMWEVTDTRTGEPVGRFRTPSKIMEVIPGKLTTKQAQKKAREETDFRFATDQGTTEPTGNTIDNVIEELQTGLGATAKRWGQRVQVIQSLGEASGVGQEIRSRGVEGRVLGFFNPANGKITLVADQIQEGRAMDTFFHEATHYVLESDPLYQSKKKELLREFASRRGQSDAIARAYNKAKAENPGLSDGDLTLANEAYSYFMQDSSNRQISLWRRGISLVKSWAIRVGLPAGKLGLTDTDFAAMAARAIRSVPKTYTLPASETADAMSRDQAKASAAAVRTLLQNPDLRDQFDGSVVVTGVNMDGRRMPLVLYRPSETVDAEAIEGRDIDEAAAPVDILEQYGLQFTPEGKLPGLSRELKAIGGTLYGYAVSAKSPVYVTRSEMDSIAKNKEKLASRIAQWKELGGPSGTGADVVIVTDSQPSYQNGQVVPGSRGAVQSVLLLDPSAAHRVDVSYTPTAVADIRFSSETANPNPENQYERTVSNAQLSAATAESAGQRRTTAFRRPVTAETPTSEKGKARSDYVEQNNETGELTLFADYSSETGDFTTARKLTKEEAQKLKEQYAAERRERDAAHTPDSTPLTETKDKLGGTYQKGRRAFKDLLQSISERVRKISQPVYNRLARYESDLHQRSKRYADATNDFINEYNGMSKEDRHLFDQALRNGDTISRDILLEQNGMLESFQKVHALLEEIKAEAAEYGLLPKEIENYFPRMVKGDKLDQLRQALEKTDPESFTVLGEELRKAEAAAGKKLTSADRQAIISKVLNSGQYQFIPRPGSSKYRAYEKVRPEHAQFYAGSAEALRHHLYEMANAIESRRLLGKSNVTRPRLMKSLLSRISEIEKLQQKAEPLTDGEKSRLETLTAEAGTYAEQLEDVNSDLEQSISAYIEEEVRNGNIKDDPKTGANRSHELVQLIRARLTQKGTHGIVGTMRDVGYAFTLGSPMSAITQLGDLTWSAYENGGMNTVAAIFKSFPALIRGDKAMTKEFFDFSHSVTDFSTNASQAILDKVLTLSGLKSMDLFGKEVFLQAAYRKARKMPKAQFIKQWQPLLGDAVKAGEVKDKINAGKVGDPDVLFVLFNNLSQYQPVALSELPMAYNTAGNLRVFYMLKTFNIKALNNLHREYTTEYRKGNKLKAARQFTYLAMLLSVSGAGSDEIKNWILGREEPFSDMVMDNLIQLSLMNRYSIEKGVNSGRLMSAMVEGFVPPMRYMDYALDDIGKFAFDRENFKFRSLQNIPGFGRIMYARGSHGQETELANRKKRLYERVRESAAAGRPLYDKEVRQMVESYNSLAGTLEEADKISYKQLRNIRKKELKRLREEAMS